jgi:hypothetical protein
MQKRKNGVGLNVDSLVRDLIAAACSTLQHDTDVLDGTHDYEIYSRNTLTADFTKVLLKHGITITSNERKSR